uniref:Sic1.208 n=1 Tax=Streptococcus pyogenes TaxID=1314 RepID=Q9JNI6_STRPY|nr:Sic1.208 [Streptococcus pyogenes]
MNIRNKIEI